MDDKRGAAGFDPDADGGGQRAGGEPGEDTGRLWQWSIGRGDIEGWRLAGRRPGCSGGAQVAQAAIGAGGLAQAE